MRFKTKNELKKANYVRITEFLNENTSACIELSPEIDLDFMSVGSLKLAAEGFGYKIKVEILFERPVGFEVFERLKLDDEMRSILAVNLTNFRLSKTVTESTDLEDGLNMVLKTLERLVNQICNVIDKLVESGFTLNSEGLDRQLEIVHRKEELEKRGEASKPFGTIHAKGWKDAKERAGDLVPIYMKRDKAYLYEDKKVFLLLPRAFVMKLLKIQDSTMMPADQFTDKENEALNQLSIRQFVKARTIGGGIYYCHLDEKTRRLFLRGLKKRESVR